MLLKIEVLNLFQLKGYIDFWFYKPGTISDVIVALMNDCWTNNYSNERTLIFKFQEWNG